MRENFNNRQENQLRTRYRMLLREAEKNPTRAESCQVEAEKVLNQITLLRNRQQSTKRQAF